MELSIFCILFLFVRQTKLTMNQTGNAEKQTGSEHTLLGSALLKNVQFSPCIRGIPEYKFVLIVGFSCLYFSHNESVMMIS